MKYLPLAVASLLLSACTSHLELLADLYEPIDFPLVSADEHAWWEFPATVTFTHEESQSTMTLEAFWTGDRTYAVRFAAPLAGKWTYASHSDDPRLDGQTGSIRVKAPEPAAVEQNPNLRGQIRIAADQRHFEYADGTPIYLLADTLWAGNTARAGLGDANDGPFFQYLADRKQKGFSTVLMQMFHGFGDYPEDPTGHRNEGGHLFQEGEFERLNPRFFAYTDLRWLALWEQGWIVASPYSWWGKTRSCRFAPDQAERLAAYLAVRYGAFNTIWAASGEYQYVFQDCGWTEADLNRVGNAIRAHNPYRRPLSIHPSGRTDWEPPHGSQSSRPFNDQPWLDHHWLQTGQSFDRLFRLPTRAAENRLLEPARPVFCSEGFYERTDDPDSAYHGRWQAWTAALSGCAGYGYGAQGLWQFYDPDDPKGEPGKAVSSQVPWRQALAFEGSGQVGRVWRLLRELNWPAMVPGGESVVLDGVRSPMATADDITPPIFASIPGQAQILYVPRGNDSRRILIETAPPDGASAAWLNPRNGESIPAGELEFADGAWTVPDQPDPEDWVLIVR